MAAYAPIMHCDYGPVDPKVDLTTDFFTNFDPARRAEIVSAEAAFYRGITRAYSVDDQLEKSYCSCRGGDGASIPVKCYRPKALQGLLPALIFMHGGGFMTCSVETHDFVPSYLAAKAGVVAFSVAYRLSPEYQFPVGLEDCYAAALWVATNAQTLGIDPDKIMVCGDSSGGNFAAALTLMARAREEFSIWKQLLIYPALDLAGAVPKRATQVYPPVGGAVEGPPPMLTAYLGTHLEQTRNPLVSPMLASDFTGLPPALFLQAECDALVDDGLVYAKLLQDAGVPVDCHIYKGMPHAFLLRTYEETFAALDEMCRFIGA